MPNVQALAAVFRSHYHCDGTYLSTPYETEVLVATVTAGAVQPVFALDISVDSGDPADVQEDMEIEVLRSGAFVGRLRVAAGAATSDTLQVNEVSDTRIKVLAGDTVRVLLSFRIRDKLVAASATFDKDSRIAYSDQNENVPPIVNDGGHYAAKWRGVPVDVVFHGDLSLMIDFNSNGPLNHSYTVYGPDSIDVYDTSTDEVPTFNFDAAGTYWVRHVAEDDTTGATQTKWSAVILDDDPIPVRINGLASSVDDPWTLSFRALNGASLARLPRGGMVILHEDESTGSAGNRVESRSRIKGIFFLLNENAKPIPNAGELTFNAVSPLGILSRLPGFSQELEQWSGVGAIDDWQTYELGLTTSALLVYLIRWHTTYTNLFDVVLPFLNYPYRAFTVQQQMPYDQMVEIADAVEAYVRADRTGAMLLRQNLNLLGASRDTADKLFHFTPRDGLIEDISVEHRPRVSYMLYRMFSGDQPLESESGVPNEAAEFNTVERKIGVAQSGTELSANERCGLNYALQNETYFGLPVARLTVLHSGAYDFLDPAYDNWVLWSGTFEVAGRTYSFDADRFWLESVEVIYEATTDDKGVSQYKKSVRAVYVGETDGHPGVTKPPDNELFNGLPDYSTDFVWDYFEPSVPSEGVLWANAADIGIPYQSGLLYTADFTSASPTWSDESWAFGSALNLLNSGEIVCAIAQKPGAARTFVLATTTHVRVFEDALSGTHETMSYALRATVSGQRARMQRRVQIERGDPEICYVLTMYSDGLWSEGFIDGTPITPVLIGMATGIGTGVSLFVDHNNPLIAYAAAVGSGSQYRLFKSLDGGVSWTESSDYAWNLFRPFGSIERSFGNASRIFASTQTGSSDTAEEQLRRITASTNDIIRSDGAGWKVRSVATYDSDPNVLLFVSSAPGSFSNYNRSIVKSLDGGDTWTTILASEAMCCIGLTSHMIASSAVIGGDGSVFVLLTDDDEGVYFHPNIYTLTDFSQMQNKTGSGYTLTGHNTPYGLVGL